MSSCSSCTNPSVAYSAQAYAKQQIANIQKPALQPEAPAVTDNAGATTGFRGQNMNITA
jgi:hypothetical protein